MVQQTTEEFLFRLAQAVEAHPLAPPTPHGRVTWLMRELEKQLGVKVSLNTAHKWMTGASRPREDRILDLARLLKVDEIWLALGRKPAGAAGEVGEVGEGAVRAKGAALVVAGLVELRGGRVSFSDDGATLSINMGGATFSAVPVSGQRNGDRWAFMVPEPVGTNRVIAVVPMETGPCHVSVFDVTEAPRKNFGGFSILEGAVGPEGLILDDGRCIAPVGGVTDLVSA